MEYEISEEVDAGEDDETGSDGTSKHERRDIKIDTGVEWSLSRLFGTGGMFEDSPDYFRSTNYFAVMFGADGSAEKIHSSHISGLEKDEAVEYALYALEQRNDSGWIGRYYYCVGDRTDGGKIVVYIDRVAQIVANNRILFAVLLLLGAGTLLAFLVMRVLSERVVYNEVKGAERQKQFITNASHELKTPLAVIRANTEMQEMLEGETEWTQSTMRQVTRMSGLIENLVKIAKADEKGFGDPEAMELTGIDAAAVVSETVAPFVSVAEAEGKALSCIADPPLPFVTDEKMLRQLITLLVDNAIKYCDAGGSVVCEAKMKGRSLEILISNSFAEGKDVDYSRFFDRFYRADSSHNVERGGYGVGLSIAEGIVKSLKGRIKVFWKDGVITFRVNL